MGGQLANFYFNLEISVGEREKQTLNFVAAPLMFCLLSGSNNFCSSGREIGSRWEGTGFPELLN